MTRSPNRQLKICVSGVSLAIWWSLATTSSCLLIAPLAGASDYRLVSQKPAAGWTARDLLREADVHGERSVLEKLARDRRAWRRLLENISSGHPGWVQLGIRLFAVSQGTRARDLRVALEEALITEPKIVLTTLSGNLLMVSIVCGPSAQPSYDLATNSISERLSAVLSLRLQEDRGERTPLLSAIDQCADALEQADAKPKPQGDLSFGSELLLASTHPQP
jgi:hypothetical protein